MTNNTTAPALTDEQILDFFSAAGVELNATPNMLYTVRGQHAQLVNAARALLTSPRAAGLPEGWKLVPIEPTDEMVSAAAKIWFAPTQCADPTMHAWDAMLDAAPAAPVAEAEPIQMLLFCPRCGTQHIDAPEDAECDGEVVHSAGWSNPPHRSHLCHACGIVWRPADVATVGVEAIETSVKADTWTKEAPWIGHNRPAAQAVAADGSAIDTKAIAESLERMIVDWYADCERTRLDWKQMAGVIKLRLDRFLKRAAVSPATADEQTAFDRDKEQVDFDEWYESVGRPCFGNMKSAMWLAWQSRASQAAAPAEAREPVIEKYLWELVDEARRWESAYRDSARRYETLDSEKKSVERTIRFIVSLFPTMVRPAIEYRYTGGTAWCDLGSAETMRADFDGVFRLKAGEFPVWSGDAPADAGEAVLTAARAVIREELDSVTVHPCDEHNDEARARQLCEPMLSLYRAVTAVPQGAQGGKGGEA